MERTVRTGIQVEWFNVSYRSMILYALGILALIGGAIGAWVYWSHHAPRKAAVSAIARAETRFDEASRVALDARIAKALGAAEVALHEARESLEDQRFDDAELAAIRSESRSDQVLRLADGQEGQERLVNFVRLEGDVRVKKAGQFSWDPARKDMLLHVGDQVKTSSNSSAQLVYFDGTETTIRPGSLLEIRELYEDPGTKVRRVKERLGFGEIHASTRKRNVKGSFHEVSTEKAAARSDDEGEFRVTFDKESQSGAYDVFKGQIEVATASRKERVAAGEGIRSNSKGRLTGKHTLPAVPRLIAPRDQRVFISEDPSQDSITLTWESVGGADRYHLVIADKPLFTEPLYDAERAGTTALLDGVPANSYYWKVASISPTGLTSRFSSPRRFRVSAKKIRDRTDTEPPILEITEFVPIGLMVIANGRTEPGASLWVENEKVDVYDDGTFYAVVRLRKEGANQLRFVAQDTAGNESEVIRSTYVDLY